jgi:hypothetical protein
MADRAERRAWVAEHVDAEFTGRFHVHWESLDGQDHGEGPEEASLAEALAWARRHAAGVFVRVGHHEHYWAGDGPAPADDLDLLPYPEGGLEVVRRPIATRWEAAVATQGSRDLAERIRERLTAGAGITAVAVEQRDRELVVTCVLAAATAEEAARVVDAALPVEHAAGSGATYLPVWSIAPLAD